MPFRRYFNYNTLAADVDWDNPASWIEAFRSRITVWWFEPFADLPKTGHEAFPVLLSMAVVVRQLADLLVDDVTYGDTSYVEMLQKIDPSFDEDSAMTFYEDVYHSLIENVRIANGSGMSGTGRGPTRTDDGTMVFDPWVFRDRLVDWFGLFCHRLRASPDAPETLRVRDRLRVEYG